MSDKKKPINGRPTQYKEEYVEQAYVACNKLGAIDKDLAELFKVTEKTINEWKKCHPDFCESIKNGKSEYDVKTAVNCLKKRVEGFEYTEVIKEVKTDGDGKIISKSAKEFKKRVIPDVGAISFFLKNRDRLNWKDYKAVEVGNLDNKPFESNNHTVTEQLNKRGIPLPDVECPDIEEDNFDNSDHLVSTAENDDIEE